MFIFPRSRKVYVDVSIRGRNITVEKCVLYIRGLHNCSEEASDTADGVVNLVEETGAVEIKDGEKGLSYV